MGVIKMSQSFKTEVTPDRMFRALIIDSHNLCPKLMFSSIKNIEYLQGNGEVGSIKQMNFTEASPFRYVKHRIDALDTENYICKHTLIEGDALKDKLDSISYELKFEPYGYGGCVCRITSEYRTKDNVDVIEEDIMERTEQLGCMRLWKHIFYTPACIYLRPLSTIILGFVPYLDIFLNAVILLSCCQISSVLNKDLYAKDRM